MTFIVVICSPSPNTVVQYLPAVTFHFILAQSHKIPIEYIFLIPKNLKERKERSSVLYCRYVAFDTIMNRKAKVKVSPESASITWDSTSHPHSYSYSYTGSTVQYLFPKDKGFSLS